MKKKSIGRRLSRKKTKALLDSLYQEFSQRSYIQTDPISIVHSYQLPNDQELVGFLVSLFSFGSVPLIKKCCEEFLRAMGDSPTDYLRQSSLGKIRREIQFKTYRFYKRDDLLNLLFSLREELTSHESLEESFKNASQRNELTYRFSDWQEKIKGRRLYQSYGWSYFFPDPSHGVAKRAHMFLRWMVRKDEIDLGLWSSLKAHELFLPLDTHVFDMAKKLKLIKRKSLSLKAVQEATDSLRTFDPIDPIRYDFSLCRLGILKKKDRIPELSE